MAKETEEPKGKEIKVFDVAKPGTAAPETGSKPMVIGHKSLATDPTIREAEAEKESTEEKITLTPTKKLQLKPLSAEEKQAPEAEKTSEEAPEEAAQDEKGEAPATPEEPETAEPQATEADEKKAEDDKKEKADAVDELALKREEELQKIIKSREYVVPIHEARQRSLATFFITFLFIVVLGIVALAVLVDAEIIDVGIDLPFDLIK